MCTFAIMKPKFAAVAALIAVPMNFLLKNGVFDFMPGSGSPSYLVILTAVFGTILIGKKINEKEEEFDNLTSDNNNLKAELNKWKKRFLNIINFIKNRLLRPKDKDKYKKFTIDLYEHNVIDQGTFEDIRNNYSKDKRKDDFER